MFSITVCFSTSKGKGQRGVSIRDEQDTSESESALSWAPRSQNPWWATKSESAMSSTEWSLNLQWPGHRGVRICDELNTAESESAMNWTPRSQNPWWAGHRGVRIHDGSQSQNPQWVGHRRVRIHDELDTAESEFTMSWTPRSQNPRWAGHRGIRICNEYSWDMRSLTAKCLACQRVSLSYMKYKRIMRFESFQYLILRFHKKITPKFSLRKRIHTLQSRPRLWISLRNHRIAEIFVYEYIWSFRELVTQSL